MTETVVTTPRLRLNAFSRDDAHGFAALARNPAVVRHIGHGRPWSETQVSAFLDRQIGLRKRLGYAFHPVRLLDGDDIIGVCGVQPLRGSSEAEIGWWLRPDMWGRGLAREAAFAVMAHAFEQTPLERLAAIARSANLASIRIMQALGMRYERQFHETRFGVAVPLHAITKREWAR